MKFKSLALALLAGIATAFVACKSNDDDATPTDSQFVELQGQLTTQTLDASRVYLLKGQVFVPNGVTLTIPAGTVILGERRTKGMLVIDRGGRIEATGTAERPIVFTSNQGPGERDRGDWGGILIAGRANVNQASPALEGISPAVNYGTQNSTANDGENSGTLRFVRIEYAGIEISPNNETNSLTMAGVGRGTTIENVQVSYGGDDGFEWFGGTVNGRNLVSLGTWDDDFDCDFGWQGNVQFGLAVRYAFAADQSGSNAFECDNDANGNDLQPRTAGVFSNITVVGPRFNAATTISGNYQHAMHLRRRTAISIFNSVFTGFARGLAIDGPSTETEYTNGAGVLANNILVHLGTFSSIPNTTATPASLYVGANNAASTIAQNYWLDATRSNTTITNNNTGAAVSGNVTVNYETEVGLRNDNFIANGNRLPEVYPNNPDFTILANTPLASGAAFTNTKLTTTTPASFFSSTTYRGAFSTSTDWTNGWSDFNPQDNVYFQ